MTDKRCYYTDPLAAAWMAKYFGMSFVGALNDLADMSDFFIESRTGAVVPCSGPFLIHADSLPLLEPLVGDVVDLGHPIVCVITKFGEWKGKRMAESLDDRSFYLAEIDAIIQRNGIAFHWPEHEE